MVSSCAQCSWVSNFGVEKSEFSIKVLKSQTKPETRVIKIAYKTTNWKTYSDALIKRGSVDFLFERKTISQWVIKNRLCRAGRPKFYGDACIEAVLRCRYAYHLSLRGAIGAVTSLFAIAKIDVPIPHYSTVCKRQRSLQISQIKEQAKKIRESKSPIDLIFDSTGLKGYGEGEWKIKKHDRCKASVWRMLHIAMSPDTFEIVWSELTDNRTHDSILLPIILSKIKKYGGKIDKVYGDKAYMSRACFEAIERSGGKAIIDIQKNVKINNKVKQGGVPTTFAT